MADGYILDKWFTMSIQALNARYWTVDAAGRPKFIRLHPNFPMLAYGQTTTSNEVTAEEYGRYCRLLEDLASLLKSGDGEAVESFPFSAVAWRECLDIVRFPRKPKKNQLCTRNRVVHPVRRATDHDR
jgi:hypothetical protein